MGKLWIRTREGPDLPGTQETQGPITQVQARTPLARGTGHPPRPQQPEQQAGSSLHGDTSVLLEGPLSKAEM